MIGLLVIIILKMMELAVGEMQVRIHEDDKKKGYNMMIFNFDGNPNSDNVGDDHDDEKLT